MNILYINDDIISEIFTHLPCKSVGQCRTLSHDWNKRLSSGHFERRHAKQSLKQPKLLFIDYNSGISSSSLCCLRSLSTIVWEGIHFSEVPSACDGIVLLVDRTRQMYLGNPATKQLRWIPYSGLVQPKSNISCLYGLVKGSVNLDLNVVVISFVNDLYKAITDSADDAIIEVYSFSRSEWKTCDYPVFREALRNRISVVFLMGAIHFLNHDNHGYKILAFDIDSETPSAIPGPPSVCRFELGCYTLCSENDKLGLLKTDCTTQVLWVKCVSDDTSNWLKFEFHLGLNQFWFDPGYYSHDNYSTILQYMACVLFRNNYIRQSYSTDLNINQPADSAAYHETLTTIAPYQ